MLKVLVVDDSSMIQGQIARHLREIVQVPLELISAQDVETAVEMYHEHAPHYVFLDMMFESHADPARLVHTSTGSKPYATTVDGGLEFLRRVMPESPIILVTGLGQEDPRVVEALSLGASAYLRKPIRREDLRALLRTLEEERPGTTEG